MWLSKLAETVNRLVHPAVAVLHGAGVGVLAAIMVLTASDVILRYVFNRPIVGSFDLTEYMMAIVVSFSLAYCAFFKGHVSVDIVVSRLPRRAQAVIDGITGLLGIILFSLITWQSFVYMKLLFDSGLKSTVLLIPRFPFAGLVCLGSAFLTVVLVADFLEFLSRAVRK
ncbi:MAG TPA: TRAP transporter small permease [Dehalococcoidales bacterium]|nr:TRAP transporter small permease [Dehalococcoidales bacterium]HUV75493.1 TRAP transporter small permease [Dehalococcoidales bacterium]